MRESARAKAEIETLQAELGAAQGTMNNKELVTLTLDGVLKACAAAHDNRITIMDAIP
jgi:hypothetical protein